MKYILPLLFAGFKLSLNNFLDLNEPKPAINDWNLFYKIKQKLIANLKNGKKVTDNLAGWIDQFHSE